MGITTSKYSILQSMKTSDPQSVTTELWNEQFRIKKMGRFSGGYLFVEVIAKRQDEFLKLLFQRDTGTLKYKLVKVERVRSAVMFDCSVPKPVTNFLDVFIKMTTQYKTQELYTALEGSRLLDDPSCKVPSLSPDEQKNIISNFATLVGSSGTEKFLGCLSVKLDDGNAEVKAQVLMARMTAGDLSPRLKCTNRSDAPAGSLDPQTGTILLRANGGPRVALHELIHAVNWPELPKESEVSRITSCCNDPSDEKSCDAGSILKSGFEDTIRNLGKEPGIAKLFKELTSDSPPTEVLNKILEQAVVVVSHWTNVSQSMCSADQSTSQKCVEELNGAYWAMQQEVLTNICATLEVNSLSCQLAEIDKLPLAIPTFTKSPVGADQVAAEQHRSNVSRAVAQLPPPTQTQVPVALPVIDSRGPASGNTGVSGGLFLEPNHPAVVQINREAEASFAWAQQIFDNNPFISAAYAAVPAPAIPTKESGPTVSSTSFPTTLPIAGAPVATAVSLPAARSGGAPQIVKFGAPTDQNGVPSSRGAGFVGATSNGNPSAASGIQMPQPLPSSASGAVKDAPLGSLEGGITGPSDRLSERKSGAPGAANAKRSERPTSSLSNANSAAGDDGLGVSTPSASSAGGNGDNGGAQTGPRGSSLGKKTKSALKKSAALPSAVARYLKRLGKSLVSELKSKEPDPELVQLLNDTKTEIQFATKTYGPGYGRSKNSYELDLNGNLIQTKKDGAPVGTEEGP